MVQALPFHGRASEDTNVQFQKFLELCNTIIIRGVPQDDIWHQLFRFFLLGRTRQWFYATQGTTTNTWEKCSMVSLGLFFLLGKTIAFCGKNPMFQQAKHESIQVKAATGIPRRHLHQGIKNWLIPHKRLQWVDSYIPWHLDAARGAFFSLIVAATITLIEKMTSNQGWNERRSQPLRRGINTMEGFNMLVSKMDLLLSNMDGRANKTSSYDTIQALDSHVTCEVCGNVWH